MRDEPGGGWERLYGQPEVLRELRSCLQRGSPHHAYLFHGPRGVGKSEAARVFAAALLSPRGELEDDILRQSLQGTHPDLLLVEPEGVHIRISQVQEMQRSLSLKPLEAGRTVAVVEEAETMNEDAANTLLKTLEEPPGGSVIILVSSFPERLLPTVVSRCRRIRFRPLKPREVKAFLMEKRGVDAEEAERLTRISGGILSRAISFLEDETRAARRREALEMASSLRDCAVHQVLDMARRAVQGAEEAGGRVRGEGGELGKVREALDGRTLQRLEKTDRDRREREARRRRDQALRDYLEGFGSWFRDVVVYSHLVEEVGAEKAPALENPEYAEAVHQASHHLYPELAVEAVRICEKAARLLSGNVNPQLLMENVLLRLHAIASSPGRPRDAGLIGS